MVNRIRPEDKIKDYDDLVKFINNSSYRVNVLTLLKNLGLLECINPEVKKGRLYRLSSEGKDILKDLK